MWLGTHERFGSLMGTVLAFDFGEKRIGVATGETLLGTAHPLTTIHAESNEDRFAAIGKLVAERALKAGVTKVVFDRGAYLYHGRVKALADAARAGGPEF